MPIDFAALTASYPTDHDPCSNAGSSNFPNQCAIRMGVCLGDAGLDLRAFRGARCWYRHNPGHILRAQELAGWLRDGACVSQFSNGAFDRARRLRAPITHNSYAGSHGIVFFQNFWGQGNQGDHIDLWDGTSLRTGALDYFSRSEEVWLWSMS